MSGISKAERERRKAVAELPAFTTGAVTDAMKVRIKHTIDSMALRPQDFRVIQAAELDPPVTGKRPQEGERMLDPWTGESNAYLHAICAALPFSGVARAWEPLTFKMRLEAAKVNAELILRVVAERGGA